MSATTDPRQGKTLVLCPIGLGNFIMATPALKSLSDALGKDRVSLLALKPGISEMALASGLFENVFTWDPDSQGLNKGLSLLQTIRRSRFTHSLALFPTSHWKFTMFHRVIGANIRHGFEYPNQKFPQWVQHHSKSLMDTHDTIQNLQLVEAFLGTTLQNPARPFFPMVPKAPANFPAAPFFTCHPGSSAERGMAEKRLPPESFSVLINHIHQQTGLRCVLVGGPEEKDLRAQVAKGCPDSLLEVETRSLVETAHVLKIGRFFLGNDSGLMHLAEALGVRCAAFFGPTDEKRTGPFGYWETVNGASRHLILRKAGTDPVWTLQTVGKNPPLTHKGESPWNLDLAKAWEQLRGWINSL